MQGQDIFDELWPLHMPRAILPWKDLAAALRLALFLRRVPFDIVHLHSSKAGLVGRIGTAWAGSMPVIFSPHGFSYLMYQGVRRRAALTWERVAARVFRADVLAVSPSEERQAIDSVWFDRRSVHMVPCAIEFRDGGLAEIALPDIEHSIAGSPTILSVGRYLAIKNPMMILEVAALVREQVPNIQFIFAAGGEHAGSARTRQQIHARIRELNLMDTVQLIEPWLDQREMSELYARSSIYFSPSVSESFGFSVAEAMLAGRPVVATDVAGSRDLVVDGETGYLVPLNDAETAAARIVAMLRTPNLGQRFGKAGRKRISEQFDVRQRVSDLENIYLAAIAAARPDGAPQISI